MTELPAFRNEPFEDFSAPATAAKMRAALDAVRAQLGQHYPLTIAGQSIATPTTFDSVNPSHPSQIVGRHSRAEAAHVEQAVQAAESAFASWRLVPAQDRAALLLRAATLLRERKFEFCAWLTFEAGKNYAEADADVGETIDFLEFYAREALRLAAATPRIQLPGECNELHYLPLGVGAVIPPWNFPLAIMAGMTCAAIVTGNTVVLKPASFTPTIACRFVALLTECGLPAGVVTLAQGSSAFGAELVRHPRISFISFTGSKPVGLDIHLAAARVLPGQPGIKRTILELGGKDAIIVSDDADLDSAAAGVVASAFGFNGQKCSACSRVIIHTAVYDRFVAALTECINALPIGDPVENFAAGPVISAAAQKDILAAIEHARRDGRLLTRCRQSELPAEGFYVQPTLVDGLPPSHPVNQQEIFGPVLSAIRADSFDHALQIANDTEFGLTGALYSRDPEKLARAAREFHVGNLYFNRKCTGAMVGAHPFGGFKMSGTDSKAGGADYLLLFTQPKSINFKI